MKKFMKAIAFVTVMCMALSTVAFAAGTVSTTTAPEKIFNVNVTEAGANAQVALMVVAEGDTDFNKPLYINQQAADASGNTTFRAVLTNATVDAVDVYVGYATNVLDENGKAPKVGTVTLKEAITEVTVSRFTTKILQGTNNLVAQEQTGAGVAVEFDVVAPDGVYATNMYWAIRYTDPAKPEEGQKVRYSDKYDVSDYGIGVALKSGVQLGLAFLNGSKLNDINPVTIDSVDVIFLFTDGEEYLSNPDDIANKVTNKAN